MAGRAVRESVTLAGRAERARVARAFVGGVLGPGHPCGDAAVLLVSATILHLMQRRCARPEWLMCLVLAATKKTP
jgi:hypothetical protein